MHSCPGRIVLVALLSLASLAGATLQQLSMDDLAGKSTSVIRGRVLAATGVLHGDTIYTHYRVQITETWKGSESGVTDVMVPGGQAGNLRQTFVGLPTLVTGQEYVLFLWISPSGIRHITGAQQGVYAVSQDATGQTVADRPAASEMMFDTKGKAVQDAPVHFTLSNLSGRVAAVRGGRR